MTEKTIRILKKRYYCKYRHTCNNMPCMRVYVNRSGVWISVCKYSKCDIEKLKMGKTNVEVR